MKPVIDLSRLRWFLGSRDVTCEICHSALYEPKAGDHVCPACLEAIADAMLTQRNQPKGTP